MGGSPRGIVSGSGVGGGIEEPAGIVANGVVDVSNGRSLGRGAGDQDGNDGEIQSASFIPELMLNVHQKCKNLG